MVGGDNSLQAVASSWGLGALRVALGAGTGSVSPYSRVTLPSAWFPAGGFSRCRAGLGRTQERARTPSPPTAGAVVFTPCRGLREVHVAGAGWGGVRFGRPSLWLPLYRLWDGGRGTDRCSLSLNPLNWTLRWRQPLSHNSLVDWWHTPSNPSKCRILKI